MYNNSDLTDEWWWGRSLETLKEGYFPKSYVLELPKEKNGKEENNDVKTKDTCESQSQPLLPKRKDDYYNNDVFLNKDSDSIGESVVEREASLAGSVLFENESDSETAKDSESAYTIQGSDEDENINASNSAYMNKAIYKKDAALHSEFDKECTCDTNSSDCGCANPKKQSDSYESKYDLAGTDYKNTDGDVCNIKPSSKDSNVIQHKSYRIIPSDMHSDTCANDKPFHQENNTGIGSSQPKNTKCVQTYSYGTIRNTDESQIDLDTVNKKLLEAIGGIAFRNEVFEPSKVTSDDRRVYNSCLTNETSTDSQAHTPCIISTSTNQFLQNTTNNSKPKMTPQFLKKGQACIYRTCSEHVNTREILLNEMRPEGYGGNGLSRSVSNDTCSNPQYYSRSVSNSMRRSSSDYTKLLTEHGARGCRESAGLRFDSKGVDEQPISYLQKKLKNLYNSELNNNSILEDSAENKRASRKPSMHNFEDKTLKKERSNREIKEDFNDIIKKPCLPTFASVRETLIFNVHDKKPFIQTHPGSETSSIHSKLLRYTQDDPIFSFEVLQQELEYVEKKANIIKLDCKNKSMEELVTKYLCKRFIDNKVRLLASIYLWITTHIELRLNYNEKFDIEELKDYEDPDRVYSTRASYGPGFAYLFAKFANIAGITCNVVHGTLKVPPPNPDSFIKGSFKPMYPNHIWNCVELDGKFRIVDTCCALVSHPFNSLGSRDNGFFLMHPDKAIYTHFPCDPRNLYNHSFVTWEIFWNLPYVRPLYFQYNINILNCTVSSDMLKHGMDSIILQLKDHTLDCYAEVELYSEEAINESILNLTPATVTERLPLLAQCKNYNGKRMAKIYLGNKPGFASSVLKLYVGTRPSRLAKSKRETLLSRTAHHNSHTQSTASIDEMYHSDGKSAKRNKRISKKPHMHKSPRESIQPSPSTRTTMFKVLLGVGKKSSNSQSIPEPKRSAPHVEFPYVTGAPTHLTYPLVMALSLGDTKKDSPKYILTNHFAEAEFYVKSPTSVLLKKDEQVNFHLLSIDTVENGSLDTEMERKHYKLQLKSPSGITTKFVFQPSDRSYVLQAEINEVGSWLIHYHGISNYWVPVVRYICTH
ncbi:cytokinesis protein 3 [Zancudomyces culisetae]|uniref:Cytokinesis protein 3 n=1 Tax=Zancudomyces culisetae TaxID=1213189 RepID=A0A1R1PZG2_ZANCU|nr:cytokinesis protein 3 [Zancudomyces culisetae]|eukprot:OMH86336.1 cytokinesis protein 3 [Zancudomyces culisetae]